MEEGDAGGGHLQFIPALHVVSVVGGDVVVFGTDVADGRRQFIFEEFSVLSRRVPRRQRLQLSDFLQITISIAHSIPYALGFKVFE